MAASASSPLGYDLNFGAASSLDGVVYGAVRPGGAGGEEVTPAGSIPDADVSAWAAHMQAQGITRVVSLLDPSELTAYASPLGDQYGRLFKRHDLVNMGDAAAAHATIVAAFSEARDAGERCVVHCRGGQSRTGLALASWLVAAHGLSAADAAAEVQRAASEQRLVRFAKEEKVAKFTGKA